MSRNLLLKIGNEASAGDCGSGLRMVAALHAIDSGAALMQPQPGVPFHIDRQWLREHGLARTDKRLAFVSRREHATLLLSAGGGLSIVRRTSNTILLNGDPLPKDTPVCLEVGDEVALCHWTETGESMLLFRVLIPVRLMAFECAHGSCVPSMSRRARTEADRFPAPSESCRHAACDVVDLCSEECWEGWRAAAPCHGDAELARQLQLEESRTTGRWRKRTSVDNGAELSGMELPGMELPGMELLGMDSDAELARVLQCEEDASARRCAVPHHASSSSERWGPSSPLQRQERSSTAATAYLLVIDTALATVTSAVAANGDSLFGAGDRHLASQLQKLDARSRETLARLVFCGSRWACLLVLCADDSALMSASALEAAGVLVGLPSSSVRKKLFEALHASPGWSILDGSSGRYCSECVALKKKTPSSGHSSFGCAARPTPIRQRARCLLKRPSRLPGRRCIAATRKRRAAAVLRVISITMQAMTV